MAAELEELERAAGIWCATHTERRTLDDRVEHSAPYSCSVLSAAFCVSKGMLRRDNNESEDEEEDEAHPCSIDVVDIKALETSCALAGGGSFPCTVSAEDTAEVAPSSPSSCLETFSLPDGQTGATNELPEINLMIHNASRARLLNNLPTDIRR